MLTPNTPSTFTVVYRTGGTSNAKWRRCVAVTTRNEAETMASELYVAGFKAIVFITSQLDAIGMPVGFDADTAAAITVSPECGFAPVVR